MTEQELFDIDIDEPDRVVYEKARANFDALAKPIDGFGDFEDIICRIAAIHRNERPDISKRALVVAFSDNGVAGSGVSQTDKSVTLDVARLFGQKKSTVCVMTKGFGIELIGVDVGIDSDNKADGIICRKVSKGTRNIETEDAMTADECIKAIETGMDIVRQCHERGFGLLATGEMGIGNTTTATALLCHLTKEDPDEVTGRGAGLSDEGLRIKRRVIKNAIDRFVRSGIGSGSDAQDSFSALCGLGGLDIAMLTGLFIGGARYHIPVIIDGLISSVAALAAYRILPGTKDYMIASHRGKERGVLLALDKIGLRPVIDANMALGEGTGGVMIIPVIDMVFNVYNHGISFGMAKIRQYRRYDK